MREINYNLRKGDRVKISKRMITLGIILLSLSQINYENIINLLFDNSHLSTTLTIFAIFLEIINGIFKLVEMTFYFLISWEGVLLLAVILIHKNWNKYLKSKSENL